MLRLITLAVFTFTMSLNVFACWKVEGTYAVDGETWKINQKVNHDTNYSLPMNTFIFDFKISQPKGKKPSVSFKVHEKKGAARTLVTQGSHDLVLDKTTDIYAKGEEGQPNSIITLKLLSI